MQIKIEHGDPTSSNIAVVELFGKGREEDPTERFELLGAGKFVIIGGQAEIRVSEMTQAEKAEREEIERRVTAEKAAQEAAANEEALKEKAEEAKKRDEELMAAERERQGVTEAAAEPIVPPTEPPAPIVPPPAPAQPEAPAPAQG